MKKNVGFTIIELLVVITIIATLAGIVTIGVSQARAKSRDSKRIADVESISASLALYKTEKKSYPANPGTAPCNIGTGTCLQDLTTGNYISRFPSPPSVGDDNYDKYQYFNYPAGTTDPPPGAVVRALLEITAGSSPVTFNTNNWCKSESTENKHYCVNNR